MNLINKFKIRTKAIFISFLMLTAFTLVFSGCSTDETQTVANFTELVMQDEFDIDGNLDSALWSFDIGNGEGTDAGPGWGNNELQYYTDRKENITVQNGILIITAKKESYKGSSYTSAKILTKGKFAQAYGRFEARMRLPYGQGMWPAFWLLGENIDEVKWPNCGEIDIMENRGQEPSITNGTVHGPGYSGGQAITKSYDLVNDRLDTGFHVFGIEWGPKYINFYVDDVLYNQITPADVTGEWVFDRPFYIIINLAVGGSFVGPPNSETSFPQTLLVDYVRVYKK